MDDNVFGDLVLARIIEPTSTIDAEWLLTEVGVEPASDATLKRGCPPRHNRGGVRRWPPPVPAVPGWAASLVLFDVSTPANR